LGMAKNFKFSVTIYYLPQRVLGITRKRRWFKKIAAWFLKKDDHHPTDLAMEKTNDDKIKIVIARTGEDPVTINDGTYLSPFTF
jgi:hypothetical protein